jgi:hypothetical protein
VGGNAAETGVPRIREPLGVLLVVLHRSPPGGLVCHCSVSGTDPSITVNMAVGHECIAVLTVCRSRLPDGTSVVDRIYETR